MLNRISCLLLFGFLLSICSQCNSPRMGTRYCVKGGCENGYGESRVDFFGPEQGDKFRGYAIWKGEFKNGTLNGKGIFEKRTKSIQGENYEGEFLNGAFHGYGKWEALPTNPWPKEELDSCPLKYEGEFKEGFPDGKGTLVMRDGKEYTGVFGKTLYKGGICYEGDCENGKGAVIYWHGLHYRGEFKDRKANGQGVEYDANNRVKYVGGFKDGRFEGHGVEIGYQQAKYKDGAWGIPEAYYLFEGSFKDGKYDGYGKNIFLKSGVISEGIWDKNLHCTGSKCKPATNTN